MSNNIESQEQNTSHTTNRRGFLKLLGGLGLAAAVGAGVECGPDGKPLPTPTATSTLPVEGRAPGVAKDSGSPTATEVLPTDTPEATPTPTLEDELGFKIGFQKEYQGADIKTIFLIDQDTVDASTNAIKSVQLSSEGLDKAGMHLSDEELLQHLNDGILLGHLSVLQEQEKYKNLTLDELKQMIHSGNAPTYKAYIYGDKGTQEAEIIDTSKPVYISLSSKPGLTKYSNQNSFTFRYVDGCLDVEIPTSGLLGPIPEHNSVIMGATITTAFSLLGFQQLFDGNNPGMSPGGPEERGQVMVPMQNELTPIANSTGWYSIIELN